MERGDIAGGTQKFHAALKIDAKCPEAHAGLGKLYAQLSEQLTDREPGEARKVRKVAIRALSTAIRNKSKDPMAYFWRGECLFASHDYVQAMKDYDRSIALQPRWESHLARALCHSRLDRDDKAVADYTIVYQAKHDPICLLNRGNCYRRLQLPKMAAADYQKVIRECKEQKFVKAASQQLRSMQQDCPFRHPDTGLAFPGSFGFQGQTFERESPDLMEGGSPKEWILEHSLSRNDKITTYIFPVRRSFQEEWAESKRAIEQLPHRKVRKVFERPLKLVAWGKAREASYRVPAPLNQEIFTEIVLLSFKGYHVKVRLTCEQNTGPLVKRYLGLIKVR